jgi:hypothetical membrane protein
MGKKIIEENDNSKARIAGMLFLLGAAQFLIFVTVAESLYPKYSVRNNFLSDLGVVHQSAGVWGVTIFLTGALFVAGTYFYFRNSTSKGKWLPTVFVLGGIGLMGTGLFDSATFPILHQIVSFMAFVFGGIAALGSVKLLQGPFRYFSIALGAFTLVSPSLLIIGLGQELGNGLIERMVAFPELIWLMALGGYLMGERNSSTRRGSVKNTS